ncbi:hypothetical protein [Flagellimonas aurea]|uniref:hypothetical protein n=1 Tax=Flagellimonas aurea TaxID=2915619 RepID=UPI0035D08363
MRPTLDKAIEKATNQITNEIKIDKVKKSDSLHIVMKPYNRQKLTSSKMPDTLCLVMDKLSKRQKRVLNLD